MTCKYVVGHRVKINWFLWIAIAWMIFMAYANFHQMPQETKIPEGRIEFCLPPN